MEAILRYCVIHLYYYMSYTKPEDVVSPRKHWALIKVLEEGDQPDEFGDRVAIAIGNWMGKPVLAMRWNGHKGSPLGTPQSRGLPTWFIAPRRMEEGLISILSEEHKVLVQALLPKKSSGWLIGR